ncbi:MAG: hypothetical protein ACI9HE_004255 [Planctomycetota bacterium]|jgi:hypothetical protein
MLSEGAERLERPGMTFPWGRSRTAQEGLFAGAEGWARRSRPEAGAGEGRVGVAGERVGRCAGAEEWARRSRLEAGAGEGRLGGRRVLGRRCPGRLGAEL